MQSFDFNTFHFVGDMFEEFMFELAQQAAQLAEYLGLALLLVAVSVDTPLLRDLLGRLHWHLLVNLQRDSILRHAELLVLGVALLNLHLLVVREEGCAVLW